MIFVRMNRARWVGALLLVCVFGVSAAAERRVSASGDAAGGMMPAALVGTWAYRDDHAFGHYVEFTVTQAESGPTGTWSDGTRTGGSQGQFKGQWRHGRLYLSFCAKDDDGQGGYPECPSYGDSDSYVRMEGEGLQWYRSSGDPSEGSFEKYVTLHRK